MQPTQPINPELVRQVADSLAENGRVLATLDDWRAILFIAVLLIIALIATVWLLLRANRQERRDMAAERVRMFALASKFGDAAGKLTGEVQVAQALNSRVESALGRVEQLLEHLDSRDGGRG